jgi:hypothetical protein
VNWDEARQVWYGHADIPGAGLIEVVIDREGVEPALARSYAEFALSQLAPRLPEARQFGAKQLVEYYNYWQAHLPNGEHVSVPAFDQRLRLEGARFRGEGRVRLDFAHDLYPGDSLNAGGLVVVEADADGKFVEAYWMTEPDAREARQARRGNGLATR